MEIHYTNWSPTFCIFNKRIKDKKKQSYNITLQFMITTVLRCWSEMLFIMITEKRSCLLFSASQSFTKQNVHNTEKIKPEIVFVHMIYVRTQHVHTCKMVNTSFRQRKKNFFFLSLSLLSPRRHRLNNYVKLNTLGLVLNAHTYVHTIIIINILRPFSLSLHNLEQSRHIFSKISAQCSSYTVLS